jgi:hypothetical protein
MDFLATIFSSPITPVSLALGTVAAIVLAFIRGWIIPKGTVLLLLQAKEQRATDLQAALNLERARNDVILDQLKRLLVYAETADKIIQALPALKPQKEDSQ